MRKVICIVAMLALCLSIACPVLAAEDTFVPSISYKDGPELIASEEAFEIQHLVVTSIKDAREKTTDIAQEDRDLLLYLYDQLLSGEMELPLGDGVQNAVIRDLVHVGFTNACDASGDGHETKLDQEGVTLSLTFRLGIDANTKVLVMTYLQGQWEMVEQVTNHGDGTITCIFEDVGPVAFVVCDQVQEPQPDDPATRNLWLWLILLLICICVLTWMMLKRRKNARK